MASGDYERKKAICRPQNPSIVIRKLVELLEHPMSSKATDRHLKMLNAFLDSSHYAFWLQDLPYIIRLYEAMVKNLDVGPQFNEPLERLLCFSAVPPMLIKFSDIMEYARDLQEYFSVLGYLILCLHDENLSKLVLNAIISLLERPTPAGFCCVPLAHIKEAAEKSRLPEIFAQLLQLISEDLYPLLLEATFIISTISSHACQKMAEENAIEYILLRLEPSWRERNLETKPGIPTAQDAIIHLEDSCCVLWQLLNSVDTEKGSVDSPTNFALWSLQYALRWSTVCPGHRLDRNNLVAIILKLLDTFPNMEFVESELADDIAVLAASVEGILQTNICPVNNDLDFQLKKLTWACLHYFKQFNGNQIINQRRVIRSFTKVLFKRQIRTKDSMQQYCDLARIILRLIPKFLSDVLETFFHVNGPLKLVRTLESYMESSYSIEIIEAFVYCLYKILLLQITEITKKLKENNIFDLIASICRKILDNATLTHLHQKCLARTFCILQIIHAADSTKAEIVTDLCTDYLNRVVHQNGNDPVLNVKVTMCAVHLLWETTGTTGDVQKQLLHNGGIYTLLDITESCTLPVKTLALGMLADAAKKPNSVPYLITWRKRGQKIVPMLMEIFRGQTEKQCDNSERVQLSTDRMENSWLSLCRGQVTYQASCVSKTEILKSCRSKIHAILHSLKVKFKDRVRIANEYYKLYTEKLNNDDRLTMLFAENFLSLTLCESWLTVAKDLQMEGIVPLETDNEYLIDKVHRIHQWILYLKHRVQQIVENEIQSEYAEEVESYILLNEARLSDALDALAELRFVSNCTERMFQVTKKLRIAQDVADPSRYKNTNFHETIADLPFSNIYNQIVNIQSNVVFNTKEEIFHLRPVSLDEDEFLEQDDPRDSLNEAFLEC